MHLSIVQCLWPSIRAALLLKFVNYIVTSAAQMDSETQRSIALKGGLVHRVPQNASYHCATTF